MAIMTDQDRAACHAEVMRGETDTVGPLTKADLRAALNAADQWVSDNTGSYNTALPLPARTTLTAKQKARLLVAVISKRYGLGVYA
jgi:predicted metalloprotease